MTRVLASDGLIWDNFSIADAGSFEDMPRYSENFRKRHR
jgi:hypothetical protein